MGGGCLGIQKIIPDLPEKISKGCYNKHFNLSGHGSEGYGVILLFQEKIWVISRKYLGHPLASGECCWYSWSQFQQSGTLYQSSNNYPDDGIVTRLSNFYFLFERDSCCLRKPSLFIFISAREFSFLHFTFNLLKIFTKL